MKSDKTKTSFDGRNTVLLGALLIVILISGVYLFRSENIVSVQDENKPFGQEGANIASLSSPNLTSIELNSTQGLMKFRNAGELRQFLLERNALQSSSRSTGSGSVGLNAISEKNSAMDTMAAPSTAAESSSSQATDYSKTNVQVAGVDEADFVKNDGQYIYIISDNKLLIIDAYNAKNAKVISTTTFTENPSDNYYNNPQAKELFVSGNRLLLFMEKYEKAFYFEKYDIMPRETYRQKTYAYLYDISSKSSPKLLNTYSVSGSYYQSRMKDGIAYIITQASVDYNYVEPPILMDTKSLSITPEIYYFDNPDENYQFNTITSIDLSKDSVVDSKSLMLGYANTLMMSENNIYIAYQKHNRWCWGWRCYGGQDRYESDRFYKVVVPLLEGSLKDEINAIISKDLTEDEKWDRISQKLSEFYLSAMEDGKVQAQYETMFSKIEDALSEYDIKSALEDSKTVIQKMGIVGGKITYSGKGEVDGTLLNQFSLDEFNGNLRVATTVNVWLDKQVEYNNVYILGGDMTISGKLENLAKDERIYSTRFIGDKLYMVTYRQVDPFFVIDLSQANNPKVLGYLKIPGYSDYLHPYDDTHIIGIGKQTSTDSSFTTTEGLKIAMFDVSDFTNPKEVDMVVIGNSGSDSAALHDHRAFLFSKSKNLLVLPVSEVISKRRGMFDYDYTYRTWNGAYVYTVTAQGFKLTGKIEHSSSDSSYFNWWSTATVSRSLYMDDNLYTISNKYIKINDLGSNLTELNSINLPVQENYPVRYIE